MKCRHCGNLLSHTILDLGFAPPSNSYLTIKDLKFHEKYYPLKVKVCENCWLVQTEDYAKVDEIFNFDYAYFSSTSTSWLKHAADYVDLITQQINLKSDSLVIEIASNDGYLLKNFLAANVPCLGIEPTASTASVAEALGIPVLREFFSESLSYRLIDENKQADLIIGNNVFAHVPNINDFTRGLKNLLKPNGTITLEFPHLLSLIKYSQFDTIYHEHFSYLSLYAAERIFNAANLRIWHVEKLPTHGGSVRIFGCHNEDSRKNTATINNMLIEEEQYGLKRIDTYLKFQEHADRIKNDLLNFLIQQKRAGKKVVAYGAAAKGNTLLNYAGVKPDLLPFVCDAAPAKQGKFMPGSHIPIFPPSKLESYRPDYILILPWNISTEIISQIAHVREWSGKFVTAVPELNYS